MLAQYVLLAVTTLNPLLYVGAYVMQLAAFLILLYIMLKVLLK